MLHILLFLTLALSACAPKVHEGKYTHQEFWDNEVHRGHNMGSLLRHDTGHDFECTANGTPLDHCDNQSEIHRAHQH